MEQHCFTVKRVETFSIDCKNSWLVKVKLKYARLFYMFKEKLD